MKTLDEVIKALEFCQKMTAGEDHCHECPYAKKDRYNDWSFDCNDSEVDAMHYLKELQELRKTSQELRSDCEALKNFLAEQQANPPLTWDELKQMEGKPVWVEVLDDTGDHYKWRGDGWYIVKDFTQGYYGSYCHLEPSWRTWTESTYGDLWQAYRKER